MPTKNKKIIGVVGKTGAGKDTFCRYIEEFSDDFLLLRFSDPLTETLSLFFDDVKKEDQQWLVSVLRDRYGEDILARAIEKKIKEAKESIVILNGVRVKEDFDLVKRLEGKIVYIFADSRKRWERTQKRGEKKDDEVTYDAFLKMDGRRPEQQIENLGKMADIKIDNDGNKENLKEKTRQIISNLSS